MVGRHRDLVGLASFRVFLGLGQRTTSLLLGCGARGFLVAECVHFTLFGIVQSPIELKVYTF